MFERFGQAEKLFMRIRALKWQATTILSMSQDGRAREDAVAIVATLDTIEASTRGTTTEDVLSARDKELDAIDLRLTAQRSM